MFHDMCSVLKPKLAWHSHGMSGEKPGNPIVYILGPVVGSEVGQQSCRQSALWLVFKGLNVHKARNEREGRRRKGPETPREREKERRRGRSNPREGR